MIWPADLAGDSSVSYGIFAEVTVNQRVEFSMPAPKHDAYLVCAVFGDGITEPFWTTLARFTAAVANPLYLDGDGDGKYQSPRETARQILAATDGTLPAVWEKLDQVRRCARRPNARPAVPQP